MRRETRSRPAHALRINGHWCSPGLAAAAASLGLLLRQGKRQGSAGCSASTTVHRLPLPRQLALPLPLLRFLLFLLRPRICDITSAARQSPEPPKRFQSPLRTEVNSLIAPLSRLEHK
ncbi:hypothetical protein TcasGA2_TC005171 [Tribolium castaneum]|uniref:Uncharacterized protein n=1 Tax=Tribolium castaneum TaxID=7070 RepID=D6W7E8_TRICA|nr:hypothetical protein TcasGA2_TC005171 [Tribolium castaneum]